MYVLFERKLVCHDDIDHSLLLPILSFLDCQGRTNSRLGVCLLNWYHTGGRDGRPWPSGQGTSASAAQSRYEINKVPQQSVQRRAMEILLDK